MAARTDAQSEWAIETEGLRKVYGRFVALDDLTLRVAPGEVFGFLGPNGAGKTTALKILLGLAAATSGSGRVLDRPVGDRAARRHVGYLPEHFRFPDWLTGSEFVDIHGRLAGLSRAERRERVPQALATVGLTAAADKQLHTYSKGMQQRVGLAQGMVTLKALNASERRGGGAPQRQPGALPGHHGAAFDLDDPQRAGRIRDERRLWRSPSPSEASRWSPVSWGSPRC